MEYNTVIVTTNVYVELSLLQRACHFNRASSRRRIPLEVVREILKLIDAGYNGEFLSVQLRLSFLSYNLS